MRLASLSLMAAPCEEQSATLALALALLPNTKENRNPDVLSLSVVASNLRRLRDVYYVVNNGQFDALRSVFSGYMLDGSEVRTTSDIHPYNLGPLRTSEAGLYRVVGEYIYSLNKNLEPEHVDRETGRALPNYALNDPQFVPSWLEANGLAAGNGLYGVLDGMVEAIKAPDKAARHLATSLLSGNALALALGAWFQAQHVKDEFEHA